MLKAVENSRFELNILCSKFNFFCVYNRNPEFETFHLVLVRKIESLSVESNDSNKIL